MRRSFTGFAGKLPSSCSLNLLLVGSHQAKVNEATIVKCLIQGCNNVARVRVELRSCNQGCRKNDAFTLPATLPMKNQNISQKIKIFFTEPLGLCFVVSRLQMCNQKSRRQTFFPPCLAPLTHIPPCTFRAGNLCSTHFYYDACVIFCFIRHVSQAPCVGLSYNHTQNTLGTVL